MGNVGYTVDIAKFYRNTLDRIDFLKFSMFNEVTTDDLLGFKFLSGLISYEEYDQKLIELERPQDEAEI